MPVEIGKQRQWWMSLVAKYSGGKPLAYAYSTIPIDRHAGPVAEKVPHLFSAMIEIGKRHWAFATREERNAFVRQYDNAHICPDPMKKRTV